LAVVVVPAPCVTEPMPVYGLFVTVTVSVQAAKASRQERIINFEKCILFIMFDV